MTKPVARCISTALLLFANASVWATETLETITITDDYSNTPITTGDVEHSEFTGAYKTIDKQQLERRDVALSDILSFESGVQSRQVGGLGSFASVSIRAGDSNQTAVYLDGIKLNSGSQATIDFSSIELLNVESVDVYKGSSPLQLGHGAIGGAINLKALNGTTKPTTRLLLGVGSFSTKRIQTAHQSKIGRWDLVATAGTLNSDNDFEYVDSNGTALNLLDDERQPRHNAAVDQTGMLLRTAYRWDKDNSTKILFQLNNKDLGVPHWRNTEDNQASYTRNDQQLQISHTFNGLKNWNNKLTYFQHDNDDHFDDRLAQVSIGGRNSLTDTRVVGGKFYTEHVGNRGTFGVTTEIRSETLDSTDDVFVSQNYNVERSAVSAAVQYAWFSKQGNLLITPAMHYQSIDDEYFGITRRNETTHSDSKLSPQIGLKLDINRALSIRANAGQYYREPSFYELFGSRGLIKGNANLNPEFGSNADIGFTYNSSNSWELQTTLFIGDRTDLITTVYDSIGVGQSINAEKARVFGVEIDHQWQINERLSTDVTLTWQDAKNIDNSVSLNNKILPGEATWSGFARVAYKQARYRFWAEFSFKTDRFYDQANILPAKDSNLQNVGIDWQWRNTNTSLAINNISDNVVLDLNGFPRPGRAFFLTTTFNF
jgi:iron complex outermembrane receptor protein